MEQPSDQLDALYRALDALEASGIDYAITGSWVINAYGIVRATHALDVVVALKAEDVTKLGLAFPAPSYYYDEVDAMDAVRTRSMFNIVDGESTLKIDFWPLKDDAYSQEQFSRRVRVKFRDRRAWALTAEDIILAKLLWIKISDSERQWRDVKSIWALKQNDLDRTYLETWAARISAANLLAKVTT
jgi:hypothetical protein